MLFFPDFDDAEAGGQVVDVRAMSNIAFCESGTQDESKDERETAPSGAPNPGINIARINEKEKRHASKVWCVAVSLDGAYVAAGDYADCVQVYATKTELCFGTKRLHGKGQALQSRGGSPFLATAVCSQSVGGIRTRISPKRARGILLLA